MCRCLVQTQYIIIVDGVAFFVLIIQPIDVVSKLDNLCADIYF